MKEAKTLVLDVYVKNMTNSVTGNKFKSYSTKGKNEELFSVRFTKDVPQDLIPKSRSKVYVKEDMLFTDRRNKIPKVWIRAVERIEAVELPYDDPSQYFETVDSSTISK